MTDFGAAIQKAYTASGPTVDLGRGVHEGVVVPEAVVQIPLAMMNRHGLVAGATGTGKTRTLQGSRSSSRRQAFPSSSRT